MQMDDETPAQRIGRHTWWLGAIVLMMAFNVLLAGSALGSQRVLWQFDIDGTRRDCLQGLKFGFFYGNLAFGCVVGISSLLAYFVTNKPCHARRAKLFLLGIVGCLFWGALLSVNWQFDATAQSNFAAQPFTVNVMQVLFLGLPLLWSMGVVVLGVIWQE